MFKSGVLREREIEDDQHLIGAILRSYEIIQRESHFHSQEALTNQMTAYASNEV